ncbi:hypothetical protein [Porphyromonas catoniae]
MKRINLQFLLSSLLVCTLLTVSCTKEDLNRQTIAPSEQEQAPQGAVVTVDFSGEAVLTLPVETEQPKEGGRYLVKVKKDEAAPIGFTISDEELRNPKKLTLYIAERSDVSSNGKNASVTTLSVTPTLTKHDDGTYTIGYKGAVQLQGAGQSFEHGEWYICGVYGAVSPTDTQAQSRWRNHFILSQSEQSNVEFDYPLVCGWTRLYTKGSPDLTAGSKTGGSREEIGGSTDFGRNLRLKFTPDGVLLRIKIRSNLIENVPISELNISSTEFKLMDKPPVYNTPGKGKNGLLEESYLTSGKNPFPDDHRNRDRDYMTIYLAENRAFKLLSGGRYYDDIIYCWVYPKDIYYASNTETLFSIPIKTLPEPLYRMTNVTGGNIQSERISSPEYGKYQLGIGPQPVAPHFAGNYNEEYGFPELQLAKRPSTNPYRLGHCYTVSLTVSSDLIVSEVANYQEGRKEWVGGQPEWKNEPISKKGYGMIEIYNPTRSDIDLSDYGIVRIAIPRLIDAEVHKKYDNPSNDARVCVFPNVSDQLKDQLFTHRGVGNEDDDATAGFNVGNISPSRGTLLANALVQPLDFVSGLSPKWPGLSLGTYYKRKDNTSANVTVETLPTPQSYPQNTTFVRDFSSILGSKPVQPGGKNVLGPGQTIVLLSSRYAKSSVAVKKSNRGLIDGVPYLFQTLTRAIDQGYCRYVVALDNGKVKGEDEAYSPNTGTMNFYGFDIPLLVKKSNRKSSQANRIVDGAWYIRNFYNATGRYMWLLVVPAQLRQIYPPYVFNQPNLANSNYLHGKGLHGDQYIELRVDNFGVDMQSRLDQPYNADNYKRFW